MKDRHDLLRIFGGEKTSNRQLTVLRKDKRAFLFLPTTRKMADATLRLYPAQSLFARALITLIRGFMCIGFPVSRERASLPIDENAAFPTFLKEVVPGSKTVPNFGIFINRSNESGRPYILLLFDEADCPFAVVKVGTSQEARRLIRAEQELFFPDRPNFPSMPEALARFEGEDASAIAYRYVEGFSPKITQHRKIESLLNSWVRDDAPVFLNELAVWPRLELLLKDNPELESVFRVLLSSPIKPVLSHGDFAPWNIRVPSFRTDSEWVVLDWERGTRLGVPAWDWLNFIVQYHTWVGGLPPDAVCLEIEALWKSETFLAYARRTGIESMIKELTFVYLLYFLQYCNPHTKTAGLRVLVQKFNKRYFPDVDIKAHPLKISVVTPSYKQLPWLKLCAASVADQQGVSVEHIIQDAQSGQELTDWVHEHTKADLYVECDSGMYDAINRGFARATGDIVCWLNSDEQYLEGTLAKVARYFEAHPGVDVLFGDALLIGNTGALLSYRRAVLPHVGHIQAAHLNTLSCATFIRRSVLEQGFTLDTQWKAIADAVWVVSLLQSGVATAVLNEPLSAFTITDSNLGQTSLALSETAAWQREESLKIFWLRPFFVTRYWLTKLLRGAYWPRSVTTSLYTLASPGKRVRQQVDHVGFSWPRI